jgi:alpha-D-ribose 1-methylphosphonate 5-triphosphate synthase subunit PhnG
MVREDLNFFLQYIEISDLDKLVEKIKRKENVRILLEPHQTTLLIPVHDPVGKLIFYAGEILVTQCFVEVNNIKGWSMVKDHNNKLAEYIAILDSCFTQNIYIEDIKYLMKQGENIYQSIIEDNLNVANATKVSFEIMN